MRVYTVHVCSSGADQRDLTLVKEGFCWSACLFDVFWALYHRAWQAFLVLVVVLCVVEGLGHWKVVSAPTLLLAIIGWRILVGFHANDWRRSLLERRGFKMLGVVTGADRVSALQRFLDRPAGRL